MNYLNNNMNSIVLGDSYELIKKIPDNSIDCIYTDIPYLFTTGGSSESELAKRISRNMNIELKNFKNGIDYKILDEFIRIMKNINCFIWCSKLQILDIMNFFAKYDCSQDILVWCKTNPTPMCNGNWLPDVEYCLYFGKNNKLNDGYHLKSKYYVSPINKSDKDTFKHPTIKPLNLVKRHLQHAVSSGGSEVGVILDPFCGSGTTCIASKELGFDYIGFEIDAKWHKISVDRLNGITANGQTSIFTDFENMKGEQNELE